MNKSTPLAVDIKRKLLEESGPPMELRDLSPSPVEEWERMLHFVGLDGETKAAISQSIEVIFRRGPEFVVDTYDYLQSVPETASIWVGKKAWTKPIWKRDAAFSRSGWRAA